MLYIYNDYSFDEDGMGKEFLDYVLSNNLGVLDGNDEIYSFNDKIEFNGVIRYPEFDLLEYIKLYREGDWMWLFQDSQFKGVQLDIDNATSAFVETLKADEEYLKEVCNKIYNSKTPYKEIGNYVDEYGLALAEIKYDEICKKCEEALRKLMKHDDTWNGDYSEL